MTRVEIGRDFEWALGRLDDQALALVCDAIVVLPLAMRHTNARRDLGIRRLHRSGVFRARIRNDLRLVFTLESDRLSLVGIYDRRGLRDRWRAHLDCGEGSGSSR